LQVRVLPAERRPLGLFRGYHKEPERTAQVQ
jgi:hypothetical protein